MIDNYLSNIPGANTISFQIPNKYQPQTYCLKSHSKKYSTLKGTYYPLPLEKFVRVHI